jgi:phosphoserine phosphatase
MPDIRKIATIALIFDFDETLAPDSTTKLLEKHNIIPGDFWRKEVAGLVNAGYDPPAAFLKLLLAKVPTLTNAELRELGASFGKKPKPYQLYPGVQQFFADVRKLVKATYKDIEVKFFMLRWFVRGHQGYANRRRV